MDGEDIIVNIIDKVCDCFISVLKENGHCVTASQEDSLSPNGVPSSLGISSVRKEHLARCLAKELLASQNVTPQNKTPQNIASQNVALEPVVSDREEAATSPDILSFESEVGRMKDRKKKTRRFRFGIFAEEADRSYDWNPTDWNPSVVAGDSPLRLVGQGTESPCNITESNANLHVFQDEPDGIPLRLYL